MTYGASRLKPVILLCIVYMVSACSGQHGTSADGLPAKTLVRVLDDEISSLDPQKISTVTDNRVAFDLFEGLTTYGSDGQVKPGIAESWTVSATGRRWTFRLRPEARFSDGSPITANDVVFSFRRAVDPKTAAPMAKLLYVVGNAESAVKGAVPVTALGVSAVGKNLIRIELDRPAPELLEILSQPVAAILPQHRIQSLGDAWSKPEGLVTSGPFVVTKRVLHSLIALEHNPSFHDQETIKLDKVIYYPISDRDTAIRKFRAGEVDTIADFPLTKYTLLKKQMPNAIHMVDYRGSYYYVFNTRIAPFNDINVRKALSMAVDRTIIAEKVVGLGYKPAYSVVPPNTGDYGAAVVPAWSHQPMAQRLSEAKILLEKAGYSAAKPLKFDIRYNSSDDHKRASLALAQMWKPLGVEVTLSNSEAAVHFAALRKGDFTLARSGWIADYSTADNFLSVYNASAGVMNYTGYRSAAFDADYDAALQSPDITARNAKLRQAEQRIVDESVVLPLYYYRTRNLVSPSVVGWVDNVTNINPSRYLAVDRNLK